MRFSFYGNLSDYYHEFHGLGNSSHNHDRDHIYGFGTILHLLQGIV